MVHIPYLYDPSLTGTKKSAPKLLTVKQWLDGA